MTLPLELEFSLVGVGVIRRRNDDEEEKKEELHARGEVRDPPAVFFWEKVAVSDLCEEFFENGVAALQRDSEHREDVMAVTLAALKERL